MSMALDGHIFEYNLCSYFAINLLAYSTYPKCINEGFACYKNRVEKMNIVTCLHDD